MWRIFAVTVAAGALSACSSTQPAAQDTQNKSEVKRYQLHGEVTRVDPQSKTATINGQKIEGWMDAMSMEYPVKEAQDFSTLHPNDCIDATIFVQGTEYWVGEVKHAQAEPGTCVKK